MGNIESGEDLIDVRDVIARVEELKDELGALAQERDDLEESREADSETDKILVSEAEEAIGAWYEENGEELTTLTGLLNDLEGGGGDEEYLGSWYPVTLILDSYFETEMDSLLEAIGELPKDLPCYIKIEVDYDALQQDYSSVEYDGNTYWYR